MAMHRFTTSFLVDASALISPPDEPGPVTDGRSARGPNTTMAEMMRKMTGRPEFNVVTIEAAVSAKLADRA